MNGRLLLNERGDPASDYSGWNTPLLVELQPATLANERNEIVLGLQRSEGTTYVNPVFTGGLSQLQTMYRSAYFAQVQVPLAVLMACFILGALSLGMWIVRRQNREYLYFCGACVAWAFVMIYMVQPSPILLTLWHWMVLYYLSIELTTLCMIAFLCRMAGLAVRRWLYASLVLVVMTSLVVAALGPPVGIAVSLCIQTLAILALVATAVAIFKQALLPPAAQTAADRRKTLWLAFSLLALLVFPLIDMVDYFSAQLNGGGFAGTTLTQFSFPASLAVLFTHMAHQLWVLQQSAQQERQKIYRDLHDDVGAKLTSILHSSGDTRQQQMARSALESLRETIHRANYQEQSLRDWFTVTAEEMQIRLQAAGLQFTVANDGLLPERLLNASEGYHLTRALRELTNNILHHARASQVALTVLASKQTRVILQIEDNGRGFHPGTTGGNGLGNIRQRLQDIGGSVEWLSEPGAGCRVILTF